MAEYYPADVAATSRALYDEIKAWALTRKDVTALGGWAVWERVQAGRAQQSRDVDIVLHTQEALDDFQSQMRRFGIKWRQEGRNLYSECSHEKEPNKGIVVDVFLSNSDIKHPFGGPKAKFGIIVKPAPRGPFTPPTEELVRDKLETIPKRVRDRDDKRLKDFVDIYNLLFHNKDTVEPNQLGKHLQAQRAAALPHLDAAAAAKDGQFREELEVLRIWLNR